MLKWIARLGYALLVLGAVLLSPLADFLPVSVEPFLSGDFSHVGAAHYIRLVPTSGATFYVVPLALFVAGLVLVTSVWLARRRRPPQ